MAKESDEAPCPRPTLRELLARVSAGRPLRKADRDAIRHSPIAKFDLKDPKWEKPTVFYSENPILSGANGDLFRFIRKGETWFSLAGRTDRNPHGDPSALAVILGSPLAQHLGIEQISDREIILPGAERINFGIEQLNRVRRKSGLQPIVLRFYEAEGKQTAIDYLTRFSAEGALPIAHDLRLHDTNLHLPAILIPDEVMEHARRQIAFFLKYRKHALKAAEKMEPSSRSFIQTLLDRMAEDLTSVLDGGTGNFGLDFIETTQDPEKQIHLMIDGFVYVAQNGAAPVDAVAENIRREIKYLKASDSEKAALSKIAESLSEELRRTLPSQENRMLEKKLIEPYRGFPSTFSKAITARRRSLEATVLLLPAE